MQYTDTHGQSLPPGRVIPAGTSEITFRTIVGGRVCRWVVGVGERGRKSSSLDDVNGHILRDLGQIRSRSLPALALSERTQLRNVVFA